MATILVSYATGEGQTAKVAERLADELETLGHDPTTVNVTEADPDLNVADFDAVLVGASIHFGRHQKAVRTFVTTNRDALVTRPTGFFQVSGSSAQADGAEEAAGYVEEFVEATNWRPDRIGLFGGALRFSEYGFFLGALMKRIARRSYPDAEPSGDVEFTDWEEVAAFADEFATFVDERTGETVEGDE